MADFLKKSVTKMMPRLRRSAYSSITLGASIVTCAFVLITLSMLMASGGDNGHAKMSSPPSFWNGMPSPCKALSEHRLRGVRNIEAFSDVLVEDCTVTDLAEAFYMAGNCPMAILLHEKSARERVANGTSPDFGYDVALRLAACYEQVEMTDVADAFASMALKMDRRAEPILTLADFHYDRGNVDLAQHLYVLACRAPIAPVPVRRALANVDKERLWPHAFSQPYLDKLIALQALLDDPAISEETHAQIHWEAVQLAQPLLRTGQELFRRQGVFQDRGEYYYASPSIVQHPKHADDHLILVRLLNYRIDREGRFYKDYLPLNDSSGVLRSAPALFLGQEAEHGRVLAINDEGYQRTPYRFMGTEDPRLFRMSNGDIRVLWVSWEYGEHVGEGSRMATGLLDLNTFTVTLDHLFPSPCHRFLEKNWVMFQRPGGPLQFVYEWHPITIGTFDDSFDGTTIRLGVEVDTPRSFRHIRGSSNGVYHQDGLWFLVHGTSWHKGPGPSYYHRLVVLDPDTFCMKRATPPFKLESAEAPVEFSLGMTIDDEERLTIAYSIWDGSSVLRRIDMWKVERLMVQAKTCTQERT